MYGIPNSTFGDRVLCVNMWDRKVSEEEEELLTFIEKTRNQIIALVEFCVRGMEVHVSGWWAFFPRCHSTLTLL